MPRPKPISVALVAVAVLALTGAAGAADGDPYVKSCAATVNVPPCAQLAPPFAAVDAELSPDGRHLYAVVWQNGGGSNGLRRFDVGAGAALTPRDLISVTGQGWDVDLSPDGRFVYLSAGGELIAYSRDAGSGALAAIQTVMVMNAVSSAALSPDGRSLYARGPNHLTIFDRDPAAGTLSPKVLGGCWAEEQTVPPTCSPAVGIAGTSTEIAVSADGRHVYVPNQTPGGVAVFSRQADGTLSQAQGTQGGCFTVGGTSGGSGGIECGPGSPTLAQALAANLDAPGQFLIVSGDAGNTVFRRDGLSGGLTQTDCLDELGGGAPPPGCHEVKGAAGSDAAFTPDGRNVALNAAAFGLSSFTLERATGKLAQRPAHGCLSTAAGAPCDHVPGLLGGQGSVAFAANGLALFSAHRGGAVAGLEIDLAPACKGRSVSVPRNTRVFVPLTCTDANGDQVRLEIVAPPTNGALGPLDQQRTRVAYTPETNFKGRDVFQFRGLARGTRSSPAIVRLTVLTRGRLIDRRPPNTRIRSGPPKTTRSTTAVFRFTSTERRSRFECKLDKQRFARCKTPKRYTNLKRGRHTFRVRAIDRAGNVDLSPATRSWIRSR